MRAHAIFNGLDGSTGRYLFRPATAEELARVALTEPKTNRMEELRRRARLTGETSLGPTYGLDPRNLAEVGWGVVLPSGSDPAILEALRPLLKLRSGMAGDLYRELTGGAGYRKGESKSAFLARHRTASGPVLPRYMPYYLLLVGTPTEIPYRFQFQLGVQHAVGRLSFDTLEGYRCYAEAVVAASRATPRSDRKLAFFGVRNPNDRATQLSHDKLIVPLARDFASKTGWTTAEYTHGSATRDRLVDLLGGEDTPAVLLTASHGLGFPNRHRDQARHQGALVCQDWEGPGSSLERTSFLTAGDILDSARLSGLVAFHFACYSAGTPELDGYPQAGQLGPERLADEAFLARLPKRLLGHPRSPALAIVGHVDRAWSYSFVWPGAGAQIEVFRACLGRILDGYPIGSAMEYFATRYAELASDLGDLQDETRRGRRVAAEEVAATWMARNDARNYLILGDPAVTVR